jgi:hypothetical protein
MHTITNGKAPSIPYDEYSEQWIVAARFQNPELEPLFSELEEADFHGELLRIVFRAQNAARDNGLPVDVLVIKDAIPPVHLAEVAALPDLKILPNEQCARIAVAKLIKLRFDRDTLQAGGNPELIRVATRRFEDRQVVKATLEMELREKLTRCRYDQHTKPVEALPVYTLAGIPILTPANLGAITAGVKNGKSATIGAMLAAPIVPSGWRADTLSFGSRNDRGLALVHFDTEQSPFDHWTQIDRARRRAKVETIPEWVQSFCLTGMPADECWFAIKQALSDAAHKFGGIHSVLIDGVADAVRDVNDAEESGARVAELHALAIQFNAPIVGVIHFNPGSEKVRGHLGSQLERKAETNLVLEKDGDTTVIWSAKQRRAPILKEYGPRFRWSDEAGMHVSCESLAATRDSEKVEQYRRELDDVFSERPSMRYSDLKSTVMSVTGKVERTAERRLSDYVKFNLIKKSAVNLWTKGF